MHRSSKLFVTCTFAFASGVVFAQATDGRTPTSNAKVVNEQSCSAREGSESAQAPIAQLRDLKGNVLVSNATGMSAATDGQSIPNKVRVTTTAKSEVVIRFAEGCDVKLAENQRLDVDGCRPCAALVAAVQAVPVDVALGAVAPAAGATGVTGSSLLTTAAIGTTTGVGIYLLNRNRRNVSPN
jgi:type 1 fimbria pilin